MPSVDREIKLQGRVLHWLVEDLKYTYLGNLADSDNASIREDDLRLNLSKRGYTKDQIARAVSELKSRANYPIDKPPGKVNESVYPLLRYGLQGVKDADGNRRTVHYIDWENVYNNDFSVAEEVSVLRYDRKTRKRPDLVIYVNGIALAVFELKRSCVSVGEGIRQMLTNQKQENIGQFFTTTQLLFAGNEAQGLFYGVVETPEKFWLQWKEYPKASDELSHRIAELQAGKPNRLRDGIVSLCHKERFLSLIHDFIIFDAGVKKTARHNQYFANMEARARIRQREGGIIWNTQGSGKSLIMVWLAKWIVENVADGRVVIITDREELDDQIQKIFFDVGEKKTRRAKSCADLRTLLNSAETDIICSLIHKYGHNAGKDADIEQYRKELLNHLPKDFKAKRNIVCFIDECHRTNSGKLHEAVKTLMPDAVLIGFTGTPLLKDDKKKSVMVFGPFIHTYKFNEGVADGVVLDLHYEARDIDQYLSSKDKVDAWFEAKTAGLTERAKTQLKQTWTTVSKLYSSKERLERIAADIIYDMSIRPRLKTDRGTAMLVAASVYEACRYWDIFTSRGFTRCAVVTSYEPTVQAVRTATSSLTETSEEEYKKRIYERMLDGKSVAEYESIVKEQFKKYPAKMKLLIVVDKLLTGFDAPSATVLYIDKSMRDHDLFQAICRVNRPDGEDKDYGYIVDYMDLFRNVQLAITEYTSEAFENFDKEDVEGLIKNRYDEAKSEMEGSLSALKDLLNGVDEPKEDTDYIAYFCGDNSDEEEKTALRDNLYALTASLSRAFANCCDRLVSHYGYTEKDVERLRTDISGYNKIKEMIKLASCDYIDQKPYEADMRYILDTYIRASDSDVISKLGDMSLIELLLNGQTTTPVELVAKLPWSNAAKAETIENNLQHEIVKKLDTNNAYYGPLSEMLQTLIYQRKIAAISYEEYLRQVVELARAVIHPEEDSRYPDSIKDSEARRALYDYFQGNAELAASVDETIRLFSRPGWKAYYPSERELGSVLYQKFQSYGYDEEKAEAEANRILKIAKRQVEYDV